MVSLTSGADFCAVGKTGEANSVRVFALCDPDAFGLNLSNTQIGGTIDGEAQDNILLGSA